MSFENGYNVFDYCQSEFKKYKKDETIFIKALQALQFFQTRSDYPYCIEDMDFVLEQILGVKLSYLAMYERKYILEFDNKMKWDVTDVWDMESKKNDSMDNRTSLVIGMTEKDAIRIVDNFKAEYKAFLITIRPLLDELFYGEASAIKLMKIITKSTYSVTNVLRFIRNDNQYLDFNVDNEDIDRICDTLLSLKKNL